MRINVYNFFQEENKINLYLCGLTRYTYPHIGNYKTYFYTDILAKILKVYGKSVSVYSNITDLDDNLLEVAKEQEISPKEKVEEIMKKVTLEKQMLNISEPDKTIYISSILRKILDAIEKLVKEKKAMIVPDGVIFVMLPELEKKYGELSSINTKENFYLWKARDSPHAYESQFGRGIRGWHIQCVLAIREIKDILTIHLGGSDLIFPHHENEKILYYALYGEEITKYWMHLGVVTRANTKMSKSKGNIVTLEEFNKKYPSEFLRFIFLLTKYSEPWEYEEHKLESEYVFYKKIREKYLKKEGVLPKNRKSLEICQKIKENIKNLHMRQTIVLFNSLLQNVTREEKLSANEIEEIFFVEKIFRDIFKIF